MSNLEQAPVIFKKKKVKSLRQRKNLNEDDTNEDDNENIRYQLATIVIFS